MERTGNERWEPREVVRVLTLMESERRYYQDMMTALPVSLAVVSREGKVLSVNRAFRTMFDLPTADLRDASLEQFLPSEQLVGQIKSVCAQGVGLPACTVEAGGRRLRASLTPVRNLNHEAGIETLLMLEEQPETAAPASADIAKDAPAVIWQADAETLAFRAVSGSVESLLGYPVSHWLATPQFFSERIHPDDRAETLALYQSAIEQGWEASAEYRAISASGNPVWCRETIRVTQPPAGTKVVTGVVTNVDARKRMEAQSLTAERIGVSRQLGHRLAYELNDPLMIAAGFTEELLHSLGPHNPARRDVEKILEATQRISGLAKQLLGSARGQARPPQTLEITGALNRIKTEIEAVAGPGVTLELTPAERAIWTGADPSQLTDVILALVSGARDDASGRTRMVIGCSLETVAEHVASATLKPGVYARLMIHGNGRGPDPAKQAGIFDLPLGDHEPGAGALAHAYAVVRQWGGDIAFSSEPGCGSTYLVYLPHRDPAPPASSSHAEETRPATSAPAILVAEMEAGVRELIRKILGREGYTTLGAGNASEAIALAATYDGRIDLLLTDCNLPDMSGAELTRRLREMAPDLVVTYLSGYADQEGSQALEPGARLLEKPFTLNALVSTVRDAYGDVRRREYTPAEGSIVKPLANGHQAAQVPTLSASNPCRV